MDGFRFDLASALCRDPQGQPMAAPPLIEEMAKDSVLSKVWLLKSPLKDHHLQALLLGLCHRQRCSTVRHDSRDSTLVGELMVQSRGCHSGAVN